MDWTGVKRSEVLELVRGPAAALLEQILARSDMDRHWAECELAGGRMQAWTLGRPVHSLVLSQIENRPKRRVLVVWGAAGVLSALLPAMPVLLAWGRQQGCSVVECTGRLGWQRALGWPRATQTLRKEL
mgnify:CR=1 FL=1